jgi:redox-sensing transcriptional repressor
MSTADPIRDPSPPADGTEMRLSRASVGRFSLYLRRLEGFRTDGVRTVSSSQLGEALGIPDTQVRKDLAYLGNLGHRGVGYPTEDLIAALRATLGVDRTWSVVLVGVGNLARALLRYRGFQQQGFHIVALFDADPAKLGQKVEGLEVHSPEQLAPLVAATGAELALLTVPAEEAQKAADALVAAGIRGILNFAPAVLRLPGHVRLVAVDLAVQLEQLAFLVHLGSAE